MFFSHINAFEAKLQLFEKQLSDKSFPRFAVMAISTYEILWNAFYNCRRTLTNDSDFRSREQETGYNLGFATVFRQS